MKKSSIIIVFVIVAVLSLIGSAIASSSYSGRIKVICWDADKTMYNNFITSISAEKSTLAPGPYIEDFIKNRGWFGYGDIERWKKEFNSGNEVKSIGDLAKMLTDFLYKMTGVDGKSVITKKQTIEGKQAILKGLTIGDIKKYSEAIEYNPGVEEAISEFKKYGIIQVIYSDGLGPHVDYQVRKLDLNAGKGVPPIVLLKGKEVVYTSGILDKDDAVLTGKIQKFAKAEAFFDYLKEIKIDMSNVAIIDDSSSNIETLFMPVIKGGGVAIAYNPTKKHRPMFEKAGIPILSGKDFRSFIKIVMNPTEETIKKYCK